MRTPTSTSFAVDSVDACGTRGACPGVRTPQALKVLLEVGLPLAARGAERLPQREMFLLKSESSGTPWRWQGLKDSRELFFGDDIAESEALGMIFVVPESMLAEIKPEDLPVH